MDGSRNTELDPFPAGPEERFEWLVEHVEADPWTPSATQLRDVYASAVLGAKDSDMTPEERARAEARERRYRFDRDNARRSSTFA